MKEKGDMIDFKLGHLTHRINTHADTISSNIRTKFAEVKEQAEKDLVKIVEEVREDNKKMIDIIESLSAMIGGFILPGGNTFFHILADKSDVIEEIFNVYHPNVKDRS